ncbi:MAG: hypothetical protein J3K34DRAFT_459689 [Monoraphidium minutum]|nr:MAG: hypothetical protein J3K34DRAFT_459689 [Monoraphidium minutum]
MGPFRSYYKQRFRIVYTVLLAALLAVQPGHALQRVCIVDLEIQRGSSFSLSGRVDEQSNTDIAPHGAAKASGFVSVALPAAGPACPATADELRAALPGAWLVAPRGGRGLQLQKLRGVSDSEVVIDGLQGPLLSGIPGAGGALAVALLPALGSAALFKSTPPIPLAGASFAGGACALAAAPGARLRLECRALELAGAVAGARLRLGGALAAAGRLEGAKLATATLPLPLPLPLGAAAAPVGAPRRALLAAEDAAAAAAPAAARAARCAPGAPPAANGSCACAPGWRGRDCSVCSGAAPVCPGFTGQANSTCDAGLIYGPRTEYKAYDCDLVGGLSRWVAGVSAICNVRGERLPFGDGPLDLEPGALVSLSAAPGAAVNRFCKIEVGLINTPDRPLVCVASDCLFVEGASGFKCATTACTCGPKGCTPLIQSVVDNLKNATIGLTCAPDGSGKCVLDGVTPRFSLQCRAGECTQPAAPPLRALPGPEGAAAALLAGGAPQRTFPIIALVSALPIVLLMALGSLFLAHVLAARRLFAAGAAPPPPEAPAGDAKGVSLLAPQPSIQLHSGNPDPATAFVFLNIVCSVPDRDAPGGGGGAAQAPPSSGGARALDGGAAPAAAAAGGRKVLLHGITGAVDEGEVLGVMGPSGSGKSTLLSILSGATESVGAGARVEGAVSLGGDARRSALRKVTAFVPQKDVLLPALTVEECVRYSALLRLPRALSADEIQERIDGVLAELGLSHVAASLVGGSASIRGVSGGERRRVTIAMALVTRPRLVIMDEPTSGLDSFTAYNLMRTAQEIAMHDRVVIMSLHQPSPDMFDSLSQVLLLAKGRLAYLGAPGGVAPYFAAAGLAVPRKRQPAEHMLHVASQPAGLAMLLAYQEKCADARRRVAGAGAGGGAAAARAEAAGGGSITVNVQATSGELPAPLGGGGQQPQQQQAAQAQQQQAPPASAFAKGPFAMAAVAAAAAAAGGAPHGAAAAPPAAPSEAGATTAGTTVAGDDVGGCGPRGRPAAAAARAARECAVLYWRAFTNMRREPRLLMLHILVAVVLGLVVGAVFFKLENTQVGVQNRLGSMFFALALFGWTSVSAVDGLVLERELVEREVAGHYYRGSTYLLASLVLDGLLLRTLPALLFSALMYPMVGLLPEVSRVVTFMFVMATYACTVGALTTALTALCRTASATTLAMNIILLMWVLVGGYLVNPMSIPTWLRWIRTLSPMSFAFEVLAANEMADQTYSLKVSGFAQLEGIKGDVFLRTLGLVPSRALESAVGLSCFYVGSVLLAFAATRYTLWRHAGGTWRRALRRPFAAVASAARRARGAGQ